MKVDCFFCGRKKGHNVRQMMIFNAERQKAHRQASLPLQPHFEDEFLREWENGSFLVFSSSKEQNVLLSACQTLVSPHPSSIRMIPWKLFCLSCGEFVQIKPFKADVCYLHKRQTAFSLCCRLISSLFFFLPWISLIIENLRKLSRGDDVYVFSKFHNVSTSRQLSVMQTWTQELVQYKEPVQWNVHISLQILSANRGYGVPERPMFSAKHLTEKSCIYVEQLLLNSALIWASCRGYIMWSRGCS